MQKSRKELVNTVAVGHRYSVGQELTFAKSIDFLLEKFSYDTLSQAVAVELRVGVCKIVRNWLPDVVDLNVIINHLHCENPSSLTSLEVAQAIHKLMLDKLGIKEEKDD